MASKTRKRDTKVEKAVLQEPQAKRIKVSPHQTSQSDQPPRANNGSQELRGELNLPRWATEQFEWLFNVVSDGKVDFNDVARQHEARFGFHRSALAIRQYCQKKTGWRAPTDTWTFHQRCWIIRAVRAIKKGTLWCNMVQPFNDKFEAARTSEELKSQYEEIVRLSRPSYSRMKTSLNGNRLHVGTGPWTQEQDDELRETESREGTLEG